MVCPVFLFAVMALIYVVLWFQTAESVQQELTRRARILSYSIADSKHADINIEKRYEVKINVPLLALVSIDAVQRVNTRAFTGISSLNESKDDPIVYITKNGKVYHKFITCSYIKINVKAVDTYTIDKMRNLSGGKYRPCEKCAPTSKLDDYTGKVYISSYGSKYHINKHCQTIERNAMAIRLSQVKYMSPCSKCGGK